MKIFVHDDGKEKLMSVDAFVPDLVSPTGYGRTKEEALQDLQNNILQLIQQLKNLDYSNLQDVDCFGQPLKEKK
jgi:hypothetical protein